MNGKKKSALGQVAQIFSSPSTSAYFNAVLHVHVHPVLNLIIVPFKDKSCGP